MNKRILMYTTVLAFGVGMAQSAKANDSNTLYLEQAGDNNTASVVQSWGGGNNDIGTAADPVTQDGDGNNFRFRNNLSGSGTNNDIVKAEQVGNGNYFSNATWNGANNNVIQNSRQIGDNNQIRISMNGPDNGVVGTVLLQGNSNHLVIDQVGSYSSGNKVLQVTMLGSNNGLVPDANGAAKRAGVYIKQAGPGGNTVQSSYVEGNNNTGPYGGSQVYRNVHNIQQNGSDNGTISSIASTIGSDGSRIWVFQNGDENNFSVQQGVTTASTGNYATVTQDGSYNGVTITQFGDNNEIVVDQDGDSNTVTANFDGSGNGVGTLSGQAGILASSHTELVQGTIFQDSSLASSGNTVSYEVTGNNNLFAFAQIGASNTISGTVGDTGASTGNEAAVIQSGSSNSSTFTQNGASNNLAVTQ